MEEAVNKRPKSSGIVITPQELKDTFLFGIDTTDDDGNQFPESIYEFYIKSAQNWLETQIGGLILCEKEIEEYRDYHINDYRSFGFIKLLKFPVQSVQEVSAQFPLSENRLVFDPSWYRTDSTTAQTNLVPTNGSISSILLGQGGNYLPLLYNGLAFLPHFWRLRYKAGFKPEDVPFNIKEIIGMKAAMGPLNIAGDLIAGAGIASKSISLDGLSQSISTTSSATNAGYGARILQYNKEIENRMEGLRQYYGGINMVVS